MKLEELNFKCILDTVEKRKALQEALLKAGSESGIDTDEMLVFIANGCWEYWYNSTDYNLSELPELTYAEAMAEIARVEPEPEGKWVDFDVNNRGHFSLPYHEGNSLVCHFNVHGSQKNNVYSIAEAIENMSRIKAFGGIQYIEPVGGDVSQFSGSPFVCWYEKAFHKIISDFMVIDGARCVYPHKIRFWVEEK